MKATKDKYSYSHTHIIIWSLQQELNRHLATRSNDSHVKEYLLRRIDELREHEKQCLKIQTL